MYWTSAKRNAEIFTQWVALGRDLDADEFAREVNCVERRERRSFQDGAEDIFWHQCIYMLRGAGHTSLK